MNCNSQDGFSSGNYCSGNSVVRDYRDGYCAANVCVSSATPQVQQNCNSNQNCENAQCVLRQGCAYNNPPCSANYDCINNQCILRQGCNYNNPPCGSGYSCVGNQCQQIVTCQNDCNSGAGNVFQIMLTGFAETMMQILAVNGVLRKVVVRGRYAQGKGSV